ncbi:hypothetical protein DK926_18795 [Rhodococcus sp. Eu-32]|uniref:hypothetical protein n=1 Tax=Rhodococcus sp. Eu-32 TaxID=1017319 RepID=UPI000DF35812|nr:hypothetical protein [Rhodococcus sp. Eu-32]RRQ26296.1 hypothetical protein DK926_18795 [Rhodococcus sp. Eu-32]
MNENPIDNESQFIVPVDSPLGQWLLNGHGTYHVTDGPLIVGEEKALRGLPFAHSTDEPEPQTTQQRALPKPSTTPPMWANDPARSRRPKRRKNQPTRQGIA